MNEYFISIGAHSNNRCDDLTYANEVEENDSPSENPFHFSTISVNIVASRLNILLPSKSTGLDNIPAIVRVLKHEKVARN